jgi:hypothetical protein
MWEQRAGGYQNMGSREELTEQYVRLLGRLWELTETAGLSAGVYTQTTDVESEANGLMTYDRAVLKVDERRVRDANLGKGPRYIVTPVVKTAKEESAEWKYTFKEPPDGWEKPAFDDSSWKMGPGGFGTEGTPGATVRTRWDTSDIWLRREVDLPADAIADADLSVDHDNGCEIYLNGALAARMRDHSTGYAARRISDDARKTLKPGKNLIAVHCHQTTGGQFIDVGIVRLVEKKK